MRRLLRKLDWSSGDNLIQCFAGASRQATDGALSIRRRIPRSGLVHCIEDVRISVESWTLHTNIKHLSCAEVTSQNLLLMLKSDAVVVLHRRHQPGEVAITMNAVPT